MSDNKEIKMAGRPKNKDYEVTFKKTIQLENCSKEDLRIEIEREQGTKYALDSDGVEIDIKEVKR